MSVGDDASPLVSDDECVEAAAVGRRPRGGGRRVTYLLSSAALLGLAGGTGFARYLTSHSAKRGGKRFVHADGVIGLQDTGLFSAIRSQLFSSSSVVQTQVISTLQEERFTQASIASRATEESAFTPGRDYNGEWGSVGVFPIPGEPPTQEPTPGPVPCTLGGAKVLITSSSSGQHLRVDGEGVSLSDATSKPEHWLLTDAGDGLVFLTSNDGTNLMEVTADSVGVDRVAVPAAKWRFASAGRGQVYIRGHSGKHLRNGGDEGVVFSGRSSVEEKWRITMVEGGGPACQFPLPTLFCYTIARESDDDYEMLKMHSEKHTGIFGCEDRMVVSDIDPKPLKEADSGRHGYNLTKVIDHYLLSTSRRDNLRNKELFYGVWDAVLEDGRYRDSDWTVKVDPNVVFLPDRLRERLGSGAHARSYPLFFANCAAEVDIQRAERDVFMFGAIEVLSQAAVDLYMASKEICKNSISVNQDMYEERYITLCLESVKAEFDISLDMNLLDDERCDRGKPVDCTSDAVGFRVFATVDEWTACLETAEGRTIAA